MQPKLGNIQALRGIACLLVVLFHLSELEKQFGLKFNPLGMFVRVGFGGVDLFFVLSGFVIAYAHRDRLGIPKEVPRYLIHRVWRIYPTYLFVLILAAVQGYCADALNPFSQAHQSQWYSAIFLMPLAVGHQPWIPQAWTLSYELAFYFVFAIALVLPKRISPGFLALWLIAIFSANFYRVDVGCFGTLLTGPFVLEFLMGVGVGLTIRTGRMMKTSLLLGICWLAVGLVLANARLAEMISLRVLLFGPSAACFVYAAAAADLNGRFHFPRRLQTVGEASYPIYLSHLLVVYLVFALWIVLGLGQGTISHLAWIGTTVGLTLCAGWLIHIGVEKPMAKLLKWLERNTFNRRLPTPSLYLSSFNSRITSNHSPTASR